MPQTEYEHVMDLTAKSAEMIREIKEEGLTEVFDYLYKNFSRRKRVQVSKLCVILDVEDHQEAANKLDRTIEIICKYFPGMVKKRSTS